MDLDVRPRRPHELHHYRRVIHAYVMARDWPEKIDRAPRADAEIENITAGEAGLIADQRGRFDAIERVELIEARNAGRVIDGPVQLELRCGSCAHQTVTANRAPNCIAN